ncbi:unnamed protein product [Allacma fusca]|uniref:Uncharacterized protein n=1 Tax=Allacma fusca TaxID=39272 RepID=A0A8J2JE79_9HEXA|nr:unnamed protein product [Allacma fusca]
MLTKLEQTFNYCQYTFSTRFGMLPFQFDWKSGKILGIQTSKLKKSIWKFWFWSAASYSAFMFVRLIQTFFLEETIHLGESAFHLMNTFFCTVFSIEGYIFFLKFPNENIFIYNQLYNHEKEEKKGIRLRHSLSEWLLLCLPSGNNFAVVMYIMSYLYNPNSRQFIFSVIPSDLQQRIYSFFPLFCVFEGSLISYLLGVSFHSAFIQVSFFEKCNETMDSEIRLMRSRARTISHVTINESYLKLRELYIDVKMFNKVFGQIIFIFRILCLVLSITGIFVAIRHFSDEPILSTVHLFSGTYTLVLFSVIYDHAFCIPDKMALIKRELLEISTLLRSRFGDNILYRKIKSIPSCGIQVGSFHTFERISTPNYLSYITQQVCNLLVTFR